VRLPTPRVPPWRLIVVVLGVALIAVGTVLAVRELGEDEESPAPAPQVVVEEGEEAPERPAELGFPAFATKNTTRVGGADAAADAAGVAVATFPSQGGVPGPPAVSLVGSDDWQSGIAASVLVSDPIGAPVLVTGTGDVPEATSDALASLRPEGSSETDDVQAFRIGETDVPGDLRTIDVEGANPAEVAVAVEQLRRRLTDADPQHVVLASADEPGFAMPAAAWAARSGDPVLFVQRDSIPAPTLETLRKYKDKPVYLLGPPSVISDAVLRQVKKVAPVASRVAGEDPVANAITFARFDDGTFGWNITDPGHGLVVANASRPLDAAAASPLSASGKWGPLLLTETADVVPSALRGYLLDIKPGYQTDPTRAIYNHAWLIGDTKVLSVSFQAQVDELLELIQIEEGLGEKGLIGPTGPEREPTQP
jgi:ell wall binding domain 2 (CWB2)